MIHETDPTNRASPAGEYPHKSAADQKRASETLSSLYKNCPYCDAYLRRAAHATPPRPEQHRLVMKWPLFDCVDQLEDEHWEFGGQVRLPGLLLHGASGTGKTTSAYVAISETLDCWSSRGTPAPDVLAVGAVEMGRQISELSRRGGEELEEYLGRLLCAGLLFIDDLDKARFTPRVESELFDILEYREVEELPVIVTTNLKGRELEKMFSRHIGPAIINRLRRTCIPIDFDEREFEAEAALAAIQAKIRADYVPQAEASRAHHLGEKPQSS
jgi:ATPase family associated with various cellular activities (AAA)